jgi:hypothetical protein
MHNKVYVKRSLLALLHAKTCISRIDLCSFLFVRLRSLQHSNTPHNAHTVIDDSLRHRHSPSHHTPSPQIQRLHILHKVLVSPPSALSTFTPLTHTNQPRLEKRGWKVSSHGMSVPVGRRSVVDREHYLDATQRYVWFDWLWSGADFLRYYCIGAWRRLLMHRPSVHRHSSVSRRRLHRRRLLLLRVTIVVWCMWRNLSTDTTTVYTYSSVTWTKAQNKQCFLFFFYCIVF